MGAGVAISIEGSLYQHPFGRRRHSGARRWVRSCGVASV